jgi:hypothetical protein
MTRQKGTDMGIRRLPVFEGCTVDLRLRQFRRVHEDGWIDFIEFDSEEGSAILRRMFQAGETGEPEELH